jgi:hypothetical protein
VRQALTRRRSHKKKATPKPQIFRVMGVSPCFLTDCDTPAGHWVEVAHYYDVALLKPPNAESCNWSLPQEVNEWIMASEDNPALLQTVLSTSTAA